MSQPQNRFASLALLLVLTLLPACAPKDGGQVGEETVVCEAVVSQAVAPDESSPIGFTVMDIAEFAEGTHQSELRWADGTTTELSATLTVTGTASYQEREWVDESPGSGPEPALDPLSCSDILAIEVTIDLSTADGALNESWTLDLQASSSASAGFSETLDSLSGSLAIESYAPEGDYDGMRAFLDFSIDSVGIHGSISGQATGTDGDNAFATGFDIADFGDASL